jgi:hypothetical protein
MAFPSKTAEMIGYRAAYICSNPDCNTLTVGPAINKPNLKNKKGESAHIIGTGKTSARHEKLPNQKLHAVENGIWLCANCHTLVDKNKDSDYPKKTLYSWKEEHEEKISMLLRR